MHADVIHEPKFSNRTYPAPSTLNLPTRAARAMLERDFASLMKQDPRALELALREAEALAWETGVPELVLLALAEEKAAGVALWHDRQAALLRHGQIHAFAE